MARLNLDTEGKAFLIMTFMHRREGFGMTLTLRVPARRGRSSVVLREERFFGKERMVAKELVRAIVSKGELTEGDGRWRMQLVFGQSDNNGRHFSATWQDECGWIEFRTDLPASHADRFLRGVQAAWEMVEARAAQLSFPGMDSEA